jgi:hypothetical protein
MSTYTFRFQISQADDGVIFTPARDPNPLTPGNLAGWSSPAFELNDSNDLADLEPDGGHWVGAVHMLPDNLVNMTATYFPVKGAKDSVQVTGVLSMASECWLAVTGGTGKFAGARGQAKCVPALSDKHTPIYRYELDLTT